MEIQGVDVGKNLLDIGGTDAVGRQVDGDVVDRETAGALTGRLECDVGAAAVVAGKQHFVAMEIGADLKDNRVDKFERVDRVGVAHYAHIEVGVVGSGGGTAPERETQRVDGQQRGVEGGQHGHFVVAVGACCGAVEIEALCARVRIV